MKKIIKSEQIEGTYLIRNTNPTNALVFAGAGTGMNRCFVEPCLCEMPANTNFVLSDISEVVYNNTKDMLMQAGYKIKTLNLINIEESNHYNPFNYIYNQEDVCLFADWLFLNTNPINQTEYDNSFFNLVEKELFKAIIFLIKDYGDKLHLKKNMSTVIQLINHFFFNLNETKNIINAYDYFRIFTDEWAIDENDNLFFETTESSINYNLNQSLYEENCFAYLYFKKINSISKNTHISILTSLLCRLHTFTENASLFDTDDIELDKIANEKTILFIILSPEKTNIIASLLCTQLSQIMYYQVKKTNKYQFAVIDSDDEIVKLFSADIPLLYGKTKSDAKKFAKEISEKIVVNKIGNDFILATKSSDVNAKTSSKFVDLCTYGRQHFAYRKYNAIKKGCKVIALDSRNPYHVNFMLTEMNNIGIIPDLERYISICPYYSFNFTIFIHTIEQIKKAYKYDYDSIIDDCDSVIFFGSANADTLQYVSNIFDISEKELFQMNAKTCLCKINEEIYKEEKYDVMYHPNYVFLNECK